MFENEAAIQPDATARRAVAAATVALHHISAAPHRGGALPRFGPLTAVAVAAVA